MGVGYEVSPLHRIGYLDDPPGPPHCVKPEDLPPHSIHQLLARFGCFDSRPLGPFRSPLAADILAWRARIALKYRTQLAGDDFDWNEESSFEQSQDVTDNGDVVIRYAAAILDLHGETEAAHILAASTKPPYPELTAIFNQAGRRGFGGRFPQLLLGARYWFPFRRDLIIEEPSWRGTVERYGSTYRFGDELAAVRAFIMRAEPSVVEWPASRVAEPPDMLSAAWQVSDTIARLCTVAIAHHLPLWTTG